MRFSIFSVIILLLFSCNNEVSIKPNSQLRLDYSEPEYESIGEDFPFDFKKNTTSTLIRKRNKGFNLRYPKMKATLYITYREVKRGTNIDSLLYDAQKLTYDHTVKAETILEQPRVDSINDVYGMLYMISGNAATHSQFYVTDSVNHFVTGALYFETKPNFDSLYPAIVYLRNDVRKIMESIQWK